MGHSGIAGTPGPLNSEGVGEAGRAGMHGAALRGIGAPRSLHGWGRPKGGRSWAQASCYLDSLGELAEGLILGPWADCP